MTSTGERGIKAGIRSTPDEFFAAREREPQQRTNSEASRTEPGAEIRRLRSQLTRMIGWRHERPKASPRVATAKVVNGKVVTRAKFPEGAKLVVQMADVPRAITLDAADEEAIDRALSSVRAGKGIPLEKFRAILQKL